MALAAGLLLVAGVVIAVMKWGPRKNVEHAWNAYRGWLLMVPLLCLSIFLGRAAAITFFTIVAVFAFKEFARATGLYNDWLMTGTVYLGILAVGLVSLVTDPVKETPGWYRIFMALPVFVIALILIIPILRDETRGQLQAIALAMVGFIYLGWMFGHLVFLANSKHAYSYLL
jgi:phosphatidate cytidylyltransferase